MSKQFDILGRRIPQYDRSAAGKRGAITRKEKYGDDFHKRIGSDGGSNRKRGYLGTLKDEGRTTELAEIAHLGSKKRWDILSPQERTAEKLKGWETRRKAKARIRRRGVNK